MEYVGGLCKGAKKGLWNEESDTQNQCIAKSIFWSGVVLFILIINIHFLPILRNIYERTWLISHNIPHYYLEIFANMVSSRWPSPFSKFLRAPVKSWGKEVPHIGENRNNETEIYIYVAFIIRHYSSSVVTCLKDNDGVYDNMLWAW